MKKIKLSKPVELIVAVTLLLGSAIFVFAVSRNPFESQGPLKNLRQSLSRAQDWNNMMTTCTISFRADREDDGGSLEIIGTREYIGKFRRENGNELAHAVRYRVEAVASATAGWRGEANVWVREPGRVRPKGAGENGAPGFLPINGDRANWRRSVSASAIRNGANIPEYEMSAGAAMRLLGNRQMTRIKFLISRI